MENRQPIGADCVCDLGSEKHYHPQCEYFMENKDWREQYSLTTFTGETRKEIESLVKAVLKSKQEEIEGEINRVLLNNIRTGGDVLTTVLLNQHIKKIKDDLKPIISNILLK